MNHLEMIQEYENQTRYLSGTHQMRRQPMFATLVAEGEAVVPKILEYIRDRGGSRSLHVLLEEITGERPYEYQQSFIRGDGFVKHNIRQEAADWLDWGKGLLSKDVDEY